MMVGLEVPSNSYWQQLRSELHFIPTIGVPEMAGVTWPVRFLSLLWGPLGGRGHLATLISSPTLGSRGR